MSEEPLCHFSLILAPWLVWLMVIAGVVLFLLGVIGLVTLRARGTIDIAGKTLTTSNIYPLVLAAIGVVLFLPAALASHQPSARWIGEKLPSLVDQADTPVSADLNDKPLGEIEPNPAGTYAVRMSPAARRVTVTGQYRDVGCDAELITQICRSNSSRLTCDIDRKSKVVRVCAKSDEAMCKNQSF